MFCAISGNVPEQPVVSKKTGQLFEKSLVEKYVTETGRDPVTQESMTLDDLMDIKTNKTVKPRPTPAASIPGLLGLFHDEWDALMLEMHSLRQSQHVLRQELSHALYQHDAACRVIARLMRERDEAREALDNIRETFKAEATHKRAAEEAAAEAAPEDMETEAGPAGKRAKVDAIPADVIDDITAVNVSLSKARKKRAISETLASVEELASFSLLGNTPLHKVRGGGITALALNPDNASIVATGGADSDIHLFDLQQSRMVTTLTAHSKRITGVAWLQDGALVSSSADKSLRLWRGGEGGEYSCASVLGDHNAEVVGVSAHPSRRYFVSAGLDSSWCFWDAATATCLKQMTADDITAGYASASFHPDGLIMGMGTQDNKVCIWELKTQRNVAQFEGHEGPVTALSFSENGYYLATGSKDGVKLWDLRKLKNFRTLVPYDDVPVTSLTFDHSGLYLAVGGADARVYGVKQDWGVIKTFEDVPKKGVTAVAWAPDAKQLLVGSADHNLRVFGSQS